MEKRTLISLILMLMIFGYPITAALAENQDDNVKPAADVNINEFIGEKDTASEQKEPLSKEEQLDERTNGFVYALDGWAKAWASKDAEKYIKYYQPEYKGQSNDRKSWEMLRRERAKSKQEIHLKVTNAKVTIPEASVLKTQPKVQATVDFDQYFQQGTFCETGRKHMVWSRETLDSPWLIEVEDFKKAGGC